MMFLKIINLFKIFNQKIIEKMIFNKVNIRKIVINLIK